MAYKIIIACIAALTLQTAYSQVINRIVPSCGCSNILPIDPILQSPYLLNSVPGPLLNSPVVYSNELPGQTTIIQDSTVANNLANALQLLVVSNLLSNTLPLGDCGCGGAYPLDYAPIVAPRCGCGYPVDVAPIVAPGCGCGLGGLGAGYGPYGYNVLY